MSPEQILSLLERAATERTIRDLTAPRLPNLRPLYGQGAWEFDLDSAVLSTCIQIG